MAELLKSIAECKTHFEALRLPLPIRGKSADAWDETVTEEQIRASFKTMSRMVHPDKHADQNDLASEAFQRVKQASIVLLDRHSRMSYVKQYLETEVAEEEKRLLASGEAGNGSIDDIKALNALEAQKAQQFQREVMLKRLQKQKDAIAKQKRKAREQASSSSSSNSSSGSSSSDSDSSSSSASDDGSTARQPIKKKRRVF